MDKLFFRLWRPVKGYESLGFLFRRRIRPFLLLDILKMIDLCVRRRCAGVVSLPEHDDLVPFSSFLSEPEVLLDFKDRYGVDVFTDNNLKVVSHEYVVAME